MAGPNGTPILDDFNRPDGPVGSNWTDVIFPGAFFANITGNAVYIAGGQGAGKEGYGVGWALEPPCEMYATVLLGTNVTGNDLEVGLLNTDAIGYVLGFDPTKNIAYLGKYGSVGFGDFVELAAEVPFTLVSGDKLGVSFNGSMVTGWLYRSGAWSVVVQGGDPDPLPGPFNPFIFSNINETTFDDVGGGQFGLRLKFQVAFENHPGDDPFTWTTVPGTLNMEYSRGAPNEFGRSETGESTIVVGDPDGLLDPNNPDSPYFPNVKRMRPIRALLTVDGVEYPLFQHFIERLPRGRTVGHSWSERIVQGVDAFEWFALAGLKGQSYAAEASGTRWANVLDDIGWPASRRDLDVGNSSIAAVTFAEDDATKALEHLLDVADAESGFGFINASGAARFQERQFVILNTAVEATFADGRSLATGNYPGALKYHELQPESTDIINDYSGAREGGVVQTASDAASIDEYGPRSDSRDYIVASDAEVLAALEFKLSQTKDALERIDAITVKPGDDAELWATVLSLDVGDRVLVVEWPPGFSAPVASEFHVRHLRASIPASYHAAEFTFQLTPASADSWFILDDVASGVLDTNKLAY